MPRSRLLPCRERDFTPVVFISDGGKDGRGVSPHFFAPRRPRKKCRTDPDAPPSPTEYSRPVIPIDLARFVARRPFGIGETVESNPVAANQFSHLNRIFEIKRLHQK